MKILITGGAGQVGTDLLHHLHGKGARLSVFDLAGPPEGLPADVRWYRGGVDNQSELYDAVKDAAPEVIYHFAALLSATGEKVPHRRMP
jgi:nucleoside-diphosphate-sugar epimerase